MENLKTRLYSKYQEILFSEYKMKNIFIVLLIILAVIGIHLYKKNQQSYFDSEPVKQAELNFKDIDSEPLYIDCVKQGNQEFKRDIDRGRYSSDRYPEMLGVLKKLCHCYADAPISIKMDKQFKQGKITTREQYQQMNKTFRKCSTDIKSQGKAY